FDCAGTPLPIMFCPTRRPPTLFPYSQAGGWSGQMRAMMDYAGNGGNWGTWSISTSSNSLDGPLVFSLSQSKRAVRVTDIQDGTPNPLLIGEKYAIGPDAITQSDCSDDQGWTDGWDNDTICFGNGPNGQPGPTSPPIQDGSVGACGLGFGSAHTTGMYA